MTSAPSTAIPSRVAATILVVASTSFNSITGDALVSGMPIMAQELARGRDAAFLVQMILVAPSISIILGAPLAGYLSHRIGVRKLMLLAACVYALVGGAGCLLSDSVALVVSRVLLGLVSALCGSLAISLAAQFDAVRRARLLGFANAAAATTAILSFLAGGWLAHTFGWRSASLLYLWPLLMLPVIWRGAPVRGHAPVAQATEETGRSSFPIGAVFHLYLAVILIDVLVFSSMLEGPFLLSARGMTDPSLIGVALTASSIVCIFIASAYGWIDQRVSSAVQFLFILLGYVTMCAIVAFAQTPTLTIIGFSIGSLGGGVLAPFLMSRLLRRVPAYHAATASGLFVSATYLGLFVAPSVYQAIKATGLPTFIGLLGCCVIAVIGWVIWFASNAIKARGALPVAPVKAGATGL